VSLLFHSACFNVSIPTTFTAIVPATFCLGARMNGRRMLSLMLVTVMCFGVLACAKGPRDRKIEFVYLGLGASDAAGVEALPLTEGYVYLIKSELDQRMPVSFSLISAFRGPASISSRNRFALLFRRNTRPI
jgi:hypothetical protein